MGVPALRASVKLMAVFAGLEIGRVMAALIAKAQVIPRDGIGFVFQWYRVWDMAFNAFGISVLSV